MDTLPNVRKPFCLRNCPIYRLQTYRSDRFSSQKTKLVSSFQKEHCQRHRSCVSASALLTTSLTLVLMSEDTEERDRIFAHEPLNELLQDPKYADVRARGPNPLNLHHADT